MKLLMLNSAIGRITVHLFIWDHFKKKTSHLCPILNNGWRCPKSDSKRSDFIWCLIWWGFNWNGTIPSSVSGLFFVLSLEAPPCHYLSPIFNILLKSLVLSDLISIRASHSGTSSSSLNFHPQFHSGTPHCYILLLYCSIAKGFFDVQEILVWDSSNFALSVVKLGDQYVRSHLPKEINKSVNINKTWIKLPTVDKYRQDCVDQCWFFSGSMGFIPSEVKCVCWNFLFSV